MARIRIEPLRGKCETNLTPSAINVIFRRMKLILSKLALILFLVPVFPIESSCQIFAKAEEAFQNDADLARLEHLEYWTGLIEEYQETNGQFPFTGALAGQESIGLVRIATANQSRFFDPQSIIYDEKFDNNSNGRFQEFGMADFVAELELGLGRTIDEKYDIQYVPTSSPVWYFYFVTKSGYLMWVTCISCGVTQISTLLLDGYTPTLNIASAGMKDSVTKALTRQEMLSHTIFRRWKSKKFLNEPFVRKREKKHHDDSKVNR